MLPDHARETNEAEFIPGVGLPTELYGTQKAVFCNYFLREKQASVFEGMSHSAAIRDVQVFRKGMRRCASTIMILEITIEPTEAKSKNGMSLLAMHASMFPGCSDIPIERFQRYNKFPQSCHAALNLK